MDEIELDQIIIFLRGNITLRQLLRGVEIKGFGEKREHLRFSLEQLIDIRENEKVGIQFRKNWNRKIPTGTRWIYRNRLLEMKQKGEDIIEELEKLRNILPKTTFYRLKNEVS